MRKFITPLVLLLMVSACLDNPIQEEINAQKEQVQDFSFNTVSPVRISVVLTDNQGNAIKGAKVQLWDTDDKEKNKVIFKGFTSKNGEINTTLNLPIALDKVVVETNYIGVPNDVLVPVQGGTIDFSTKGGAVTSMVVQESTRASNFGNTMSAATSSELTFNYLGSFDSRGVPDYLEPERDAISAQLLEYINASLPEKQPVPEYHPTYLANGKKTTLDIIESADVWITFVHEGAGFRNAIGYYTYDTDSPPQSINDISNVNVIFPNLSFAGSGGGLYSGDKVNIGQFEAGTSIGLTLMADGWDGTNSEDYYHIVYADKRLNPEADEDLKQHNVLLWDAENELFLLGFEDILRDHRPFRCDNDFNDAILFITSNPVEAISTVGVNPVDKPGTLDSDGDGINDIFDEYPNDPTKAYDSYYPSVSTYGTFAFEDNWPDYGDYDFNDLVIDYQFKHILNSDNQVVQMDPTFKIRAIGAGFRNGFGFSTELSPGDVASVTGHSLNSGYINLNGNGTESGQSNAVFIVTDNAHDHFSTGGFVNTQNEDAYYDPVDISMQIVFNAPKTLEQIGTVPYNPFLMVSRDRSREVHLPGYEPTDKVDTDFFGTLDDDTDVGAGVYYRSKTDLPWAIHLPESFAYPKEKADIRQGHLRFSDWARSSGFTYMDWYRDNQNYRSHSHLYNK